MKSRCKGCKHIKVITAQDGYKFAGCFRRPYKGKAVWEIKECPIGKVSRR